jgi:hypothetical protein
MAYMGDVDQLGGLKKLAKKVKKAAKKAAKVVVPIATGGAGLLLTKKVIETAAEKVSPAKAEAVADASRQATAVAPHISRRNGPRIRHALRTGSSGGAVEIAVGASKSGADPLPLVKAAVEPAIVTPDPPVTFASSPQPSVFQSMAPQSFAAPVEESAPVAPVPAAAGDSSKVPLILLALGVGGFFLMRSKRA